MRRKRSLIQIYLVSLIALAVIPVAILGYIWFASEYERFTDQSQNWRDTFVESRHELLRREVNKAVEYIDYKRSQLKRRLNQELRQEVAIALALIGNVHKEYGRGAGDTETLERVRDILAPLRFHDGKGFFFALSGDNQTLLAPLHPENRQRLPHDDRLLSFSRQIQEATAGKKQSFLEFRFKKQTASRTSAERNLSFVYYYKPLDLYVGASVYVRDEIRRIQQEVIDRLSAVPFDPDSSVLFVTDLQGKQLVNSYNPEQLGQSLPGIDALVVQSLIDDEGEAPGKLVDLQWTRRDQNLKAPAASYIRADTDWGWVIGSGFFLDKLNAMIEEERRALQERVTETVMFIAFIAFGLMMVAAVVARRLAALNAKVFSTFQEFFAEASKRSTRIQIDELPFAEFVRLAEDANYMVETRSATERALKLSERRFQLALDASQNHLWDLDLQTGLMSVGDGFYRQLGYPESDDKVDISAFKRICHPNDYQVLSEVLGSWETQSTGLSIEFRVIDNDGHYHWILTRGDVVESDSSGKPLRAMGIMSDISERKRMEQELVEARIAAEDANHAKSQFLSSVSHELRTPLNGVLGYAQLLQRQQGLPEKSRNYLGAIESCGQHLLNLINDVLDLAKIESGNLNIEYRPVNVADALSSVSDIVRQRAEAKGLEYRQHIAANVPARFRTDEVKLRQILVNLLDNAVKFTHAGYIELDLVVDDAREYVHFTVTDSGIGIPPEQLQEIFEPFRQVNQNDGKGTGLGLSICRRLCEAMGGELTVSSEVDKGTVFHVLLPVRGAEEGTEVGGDMAAELAVTAVPTAATPPMLSPKLSVIVADDNTVNREVLVGMLQEHVSLIREACNGREVLELLKAAPADLVLMDLRMPEMDGIEATRAIKANPDTHDTLVFMVTASAGVETIERTREAGADAFVAKPVQFEELLRTIAEHGEQEAAAEPASAAAAHSNGGGAATAAVAVTLPEASRDKLLELLSVGDIAAMESAFDALAKSHPECRDAANRGRQLLSQFDFDGLQLLLRTSAAQ